MKNNEDKDYMDICYDVKNFKHARVKKFALALQIDSHTNDSCTAGILDSCELMYNNKLYKYNNIITLIELLNIIIKEQGLTYYNEYTKDRIIVYTAHYNQCFGFLRPWITNSSPQGAEILSFFELRDLSSVGPINDDVSINVVYGIGNTILNQMIEDKALVYTVNQAIRKSLKKAAKKHNEQTIAVYPKTYTIYEWQRQCSLGGVCYAPICDYTITVNTIMADRTSAYPADLLFEKHCISEPRKVSTSAWRYFLTCDDKISIGIYEITYIPNNKLGKCFRTVKNKNDRAYKPSHGMVTEKFTMTNIDLITFLEIYPQAIVNCTYLEEYDIDYLPEYICKAIEHEFIIKSSYAKDSAEYCLAKVRINGINGNTIRSIDRETFKRERKNPYLAPMWGVCAIAYARQKLIRLGMKLEGWYYSDTDSIFYKDTEFNNQIIDNFNEAEQLKAKRICEERGFNYEAMKGIGSFKKEQIKNLYVYSTKHYEYDDSDNNHIVKAAGYRGQHYIDSYTEDSWYKRPINGVTDDDMSLEDKLILFKQMMMR